MFAKVDSWCGSRLGGSAPITASSTPPRRGVSAASSRPAAARAVTIRARVRRATRAGRRRMSVVMGYLQHAAGRDGGERGGDPAVDVPNDLAFGAYTLPRA